MENEAIKRAKERLISEGFTLYRHGKCCGGKLTSKYKYKDSIWEVWILDNRLTFFIYKGSKAIKGKGINLFDDTLNEYLEQIKGEITA